MASVKMPTPAELKQVGSELGHELSDADVAFFLDDDGRQRRRLQSSSKRCPTTCRR